MKKVAIFDIDGTTGQAEVEKIRQGGDFFV